MLMFSICIPLTVIEVHPLRQSEKESMITNTMLKMQVHYTTDFIYNTSKLTAVSSIKPNKGILYHSSARGTQIGF